MIGTLFRGCNAERYSIWGREGSDMSWKFALIVALALDAPIISALQSFSRSLVQPISSTGYSKPAISNEEDRAPSREEVKITWSTPTSELILSNGEKTSVNYTFS